MKWILEDYLKRHGISAYALWKASGLSNNTIYPMANGKAERISLATLATVIKTLREMTNEHTTIADILELD